MATRALIAEKGVGSTRVTEIAERADVASGSFYNHFNSKEEAVEAVVATSLEELAGRLETTSIEDPAEIVSIAIRRIVGLAYEDRDFARLIVYLAHADALFTTALHPAALDALEPGIRSARFQITDIDVALTALLGGALALMRSIVDERIGEGAQLAYAEMTLRALGVPAREATRLVRRPLPLTPPK